MRAGEGGGAWQIEGRSHLSTEAVRAARFQGLIWSPPSFENERGGALYEMFRTGTGCHKANLITAGLQMEHERTDADAETWYGVGHELGGVLNLSGTTEINFLA